jgi:two-component system chemotaxis response regulator CheB
LDTRRLIEATCPECRGPVTEIQSGAVIEYHCLVGHRYSLIGILLAHYETEERALWAAVVGLEEGEKLIAAVAPHLAPETASKLHQDAEDKRKQASEIRRVLNELKAYRLGDT